MTHQRYSNAGLDSFQTRDADLNAKKLDLRLRPWSLMLSYNLDLAPFGPCNSEPLKLSKSSRLQMFFKIRSLKDFAILTWKHLCWGLFFIKLQAFRPVSFWKISITGVSCGYCEIFKNSFFYRKPPVVASDSPTTVQ